MTIISRKSGAIFREYSTFAIVRGNSSWSVLNFAYFFILASEQKYISEREFEELSGRGTVLTARVMQWKMTDGQNQSQKLLT